MPSITLEQLKEACRAHDNAVDLGASFEDVVAKRGLSAKDVMYVAEQRALRMILAMRGIAVSSEPIRLSKVEVDILASFASMWMDGLSVGIKCTEKK